MAAPPALKFATIWAVTSAGYGLTPRATMPWLAANTWQRTRSALGSPSRDQPARNVATSSSRPSEPGGLVSSLWRARARADASASGRGRWARQSVRSRGVLNMAALVDAASVYGKPARCSARPRRCSARPLTCPGVLFTDSQWNRVIPKGCCPNGVPKNGNAEPDGPTPRRSAAAAPATVRGECGSEEPLVSGASAANREGGPDATTRKPGDLPGA